jgi:hypothetical protein
VLPIAHRSRSWPFGPGRRPFLRQNAPLVVQPRAGCVLAALMLQRG